MFSLIRPFFEIAFFKRTPDTLPFGVNYLFWVLSISLLVSCLVMYVANALTVKHIVLFFSAFLVFAGLLYSFLSFLNKKERFLQTLSASVGADIAINLSIIPAVYATEVFPESSISFKLGGTAILLSLAWSVLVLAHILQAASELKYSDCLLFSVAINFIMLTLSYYL